MWNACCETPASATTPSRSCARSPPRRSACPDSPSRPPLSQLPVRLAINPNAPIGACLNADESTALAELVAAAPVFHPATAAEAVMLDANNEARPAVYLDALMLSPVLLERGARREPSSSADLPRVKQGQYALGARPACSLQKSYTLIGCHAA
jgi:hypothetical protein